MAFSRCIIFFPAQLLGAVIQHEKPELEVQKSKLLKQEEELKIELAKLEDALLEVTKKSIVTFFKDFF